MEPSKFQVGPDTEFSEIDLEDEEFTLPDGTRLTEERAQRLGEEVSAHRTANLVPGRKSLSGERKHSPTLQVRLPEDLLAELQAAADTETVSVSKLTRRVLSAWVVERRGQSGALSDPPQSPGS